MNWNSHCKDCGKDFDSWPQPKDLCSDCRRKQLERAEVKKICKCGTEMQPYFYKSDYQMGGFGVRWSCPKGCYYKNDPSARWKFNVRDSGVESPDGWRTEGVKVAELESPVPLLQFFVDGVEIKLDRYEDIEVTEKWVRRNLKTE